MNPDRIAEHINRVPKGEFSLVAKIVAEAIVGGKVFHVDGPYDGGADWVPQSGTNELVVIQDTTDTKRLESKVVGDSKRAANELNAKQFVFLVGRPLSNLKRSRFSTKASVEAGIPVQVLSSRQIAEILIEEKLLPRFANALGYPSREELLPNSQLPRESRLIYANLVLSDDVTNLKSNVFHDAIILAFRVLGEPGSRTSIIQLATDLLTLSPLREESLQRAFDSLLGQQRISRSPNSQFCLSEEAEAEVHLATLAYERDFEELRQECNDALASTSSTKDVDSRLLTQRLTVASIYYSLQHFLDSKLVDITPESPFYNLSRTPLVLKEMTESEMGLDQRDAALLLEKLISVTSSHRFTRRLLSSTLFLVLEGASPLQSARALGCPSSWRDVNVYLDTSTAIPFLCSAFFSPVDSRFAKTSHRAVQKLLELGCQITIPDVYINECAAHLVKAIELLEVTGNSRVLAYSTNGWTSHYIQLREQADDHPESLAQFLGAVARNSLHPGADRSGWIKRIEADLRQTFADVGVLTSPVSGKASSMRTAIEKSYMSAVHSPSGFKDERASIVVSHDVEVLNAVSRSVEQGLHFATLSWDHAMMKVGAELSPACGWVGDAVAIIDFIAGDDSRSEMEITQASHMLASVREDPLECAAAVIERIGGSATDSKSKWRARERINELTEQMLTRMNTEPSEFKQWARREEKAIMNSFKDEIQS